MMYELSEEVYKKDLIIPKGWRLIEDWELLKLSRTDEKIQQLLVKGWLWCNTVKGTWAAGLNYNNDDFHFDGSNYLNLGRSRGVLIKKEKVGMNE